MIDRPASQPSRYALPRNTSSGEAPSIAPGAYGTPFWFAYVSNTCMMVAISLLFRYADLVKVLGGGEWELGWIVGVGMVGSLLMRVAQGVGIDHYGPGRVWIWSVLAFSVVCWCHVWLTTAQGPLIYLLRIAFCTAVAGSFGASITYISSRVPVVRVAEVIGMLGTSGFLGMIIGTRLGDWICGKSPLPWQVHLMFYVAAGLGLASCAFAMLATRGVERPVPQPRPPLLQLLRQYHPGMLLLVALTVGIGVGMPTTFLRPYTSELGLPGIALFFWVYAPTAFLVRMATRRWPERFGIRLTVCCGLGSMAVSMCLYLVVTSLWMLVVPAVFAGIAHAFLFPSVVGGGSTRFPSQFRGLGVTVMLSMVDLGSLIGAPLAGLILEGSRRSGIPAYPTMFLSMAALIGTVCLLYGLVARNIKLGDEPSARESKQQAPTLHEVVEKFVCGVARHEPLTACERDGKPKKQPQCDEVVS